MATRKDNGEGSTRKLDNGTWECVMQSKYVNPDSKDMNPKRIKRRAKTEKEAIKKCKMDLLAWEKAFERSQNQKIDPKKTFGEYMEEFIDEEVKPNITASTYKTYIYTMNRNFYSYKISKLQLKNLSTVEFEIFFDTVIHDKSTKTAAFPIQLCKRCSTWLYSESLIPEDYASTARSKREKRADEFNREIELSKKEYKEIFTPEDIEKFYYAYQNDMSDYAPVILIILETFMRGQEVLALTLDDIDFETNTITIRSAVSKRFIDNDKTKGLEKYVKVPKNGKSRTVYMSPLARECVEYLIERAKTRCRSNPDNLLFPSYLRPGKMRSMDAFEIQFSSLCNKLGIDRDVRVRITETGGKSKKGLSVHALRHTGITMANTASGANVVNTALMAGHTAIRTENIYTHSTIDALKSVQTPSSILQSKLEDKSKADEDKELYEMYLKLKKKFEE